MEEYTLITKNRTRKKVFNLFKDVSNSFPFIGATDNSYKCVYKRVNKSVLKGSRLESFEDTRKSIRTYKKMYGRKLIYFKLLI